MKKSRIIAAISALLVLATVFCFPAAADSASISTNTSVTVGTAFSVTVTFTSSSKSGLGAVDGVLSYDSSLLKCTSNPGGTNTAGTGKYKISFYAESKGISSKKYTFKFQALKTGKASLKLSSDITDFDMVATVSKSASVNVSIVDKSSLSSNANLKSLTVEGGKLSPAFNASTTSYTMNIPYTVTKVVVSAVCADSKAEYAVEGSSTMKLGKNTRTVVVTAPSGAKKRYTITIYRADADGNIPSDDTPEAADFTVTINGTVYTPAKDYTVLENPQGYTISSARVNGKEIAVLKSDVGRIIIFATPEEGEGSFFEFDEKTNTFSPITFVTAKGATYTVLTPPENTEVPPAFYLSNEKIGDVDAAVYKYVDSAYNDFTVFYGESSDGNAGFYRLDKSDNTVQRAMDFTNPLAVDTTVPVYKGFAQMSVPEKIVVAAILFVVLGLIAIAVLVIIKLCKHKKPKIKKEEE